MPKSGVKRRIIKADRLADMGLCDKCPSLQISSVQTPDPKAHARVNVVPGNELAQTE
jgi:hypothetical protein